MAHIDDKDLVEMLRSGIPTKRSKALNILYSRYYKIIRAYICKNSGQEFDAKDIFQETIIVFYEKVNSPDFNLSGSIKNYIFSVCRNIWLNRLKKSGKKIPLDTLDQLDDLSEGYPEILDVPNKQEDPEFDQLISKLGDGCKKILVLFYFHKMSMKQIASQLNLANGGVAKNKKARCIAKLKEIYKLKVNKKE